MLIHLKHVRYNVSVNIFKEKRERGLKMSWHMAATQCIQVCRCGEDDLQGFKPEMEKKRFK